MPSKSGWGNVKIEALKASPNGCNGWLISGAETANEGGVPAGATAGEAFPDSSGLVAIELVSLGTGFLAARGAFVAGAVKFWTDGFMASMAGPLTFSMRKAGGPTSGRYGMAACVAVPSASKAASFSGAVPDFINRLGMCPGRCYAAGCVIGKFCRDLRIIFKFCRLAMRLKARNVIGAYLDTVLAGSALNRLNHSLFKTLGASKSSPWREISPNKFAH